MNLTLFSDVFEQGYIYNNLNGYESTEERDGYLHKSRIRTRDMYRYNGDGESINIKVITNISIPTLYCAISFYGENGDWINVGNECWFSTNTKMNINQSTCDITITSSIFSSNIRYFRISLARTLNTASSTDQLFPYNISYSEISSFEYWKMGVNGPIPSLAPNPVSSMQEPYPNVLWRISSNVYRGFPYNKLQNIDLNYKESMKKTYPYTLWRIRDNYNDGFPFTYLHKGIKYVEPLREYGEIELLDQVHVISDPHGLDDYFPVRKITIPLNKVEETDYILGKGYRTNKSSLSRIINKL